MGGNKKLPKCWVEGSDDLHTLLHLLNRHGIDLKEKTGPVYFYDSGGIDEIRKAIHPTVNGLDPGCSVGFVVDANSSISGRWESIKDKLKVFEIDLPDSCPKDGFIGEISDIKVRVGVWIMPDCETDQGKLEDFIFKLIPEDDQLLDFARSSTAEAKIKGARFGDKDQIKAELHAWLAWQERPGCPYGTAIKAEYLDHDSDAASRFVAWFKKLYQQYLP